MSITRQICRVIESEAINRKIIIELNGKLLKTEKILGLDFRIGDYACIQTFVGSEKSLVVPLSSEELNELKNSKKSKTKEKEEFNYYIPLGLIVPADEDIDVEKFFEIDFSDFSKSLNKDLIKDPYIIDRLKAIFDGDDSEEKIDSSIRDVFPVVAVQTNEEFQELKINVYKKADEMLIRKLVNEQSNREVHQFLMDRIDNISNEKEHIEFFKSLGYYLERLKKIQTEKSFSSSKMGVIFYPIYCHYLKRFNNENMEKWIQFKSNKSQV